MYSIWFFLLIFCGIFGAAELLRLFYGAVVGLLARKTRSKGGGQNRRT